MSSETLLEIRALAAEFAGAELRPHNERWDHERALDDDVAGKLAELGFPGMLLPESAGGMGFDLATWTAALEELAWGEPAVAVLVAHSAVAADIISRSGAAADVLPALAAGEAFGCIALDGDGVRGVRSGDAYTLSGAMRWVTAADRASVAVVAAETDEGAAWFMVPPESMQPGARAATLGLRPLFIGDVAFSGTAVRLGAPVAEALDVAALATAAIAVGIARAALGHAVRYANEREQFGRPIRAFEGIQHKLAEMATRVAAARALVERAAAAPGDGAAVAMAKLAAGSCAMFVTTEAVQIFGGYGYMRDYPVEKLMRDARAMELMNGSSELQRRRIAQSLYASE